MFEVLSSGEEKSILHESANSNMGDSGSDPLAEESELQQVQNVNQSRQEFITRETEGIFSRLSSSETPAKLRMHHSEIIMALRLLGSTIDILGCALGDVNVDVIHDLIRQYKECLNTKMALKTNLTEVAKEIEDLDVKEASIREAEKRVRQMLEKHEAKKTSLNMQKMNL
ncbi:unnamed protein product [Prunus armeniaca]